MLDGTDLLWTLNVRIEVLFTPHDKQRYMCMYEYY